MKDQHGINFHCYRPRITSDCDRQLRFTLRESIRICRRCVRCGKAMFTEREVDNNICKRCED